MKTEDQAYNVNKSRSFQLCFSNITVLCIICFVWILAPDQLNLNALLTSFNYNSYMHHMVKETSMCHTELYNHTSFHSLFNF